jgi:hypothetical protein
MTISAGTKLGPYEILEAIGAGVSEAGARGRNPE